MQNYPTMDAAVRQIHKLAHGTMILVGGKRLVVEKSNRMSTFRAPTDDDVDTDAGYIIPTIKLVLGLGVLSMITVGIVYIVRLIIGV